MKCTEISRKILLTVTDLSQCGSPLFPSSIVLTPYTVISCLGIGTKLPAARTANKRELE